MKIRLFVCFLVACLLLGAFATGALAQTKTPATPAPTAAPAANAPTPTPGPPAPPPQKNFPPAKADADAAKACADLVNLKLPDTTINSADWINPVEESAGLVINGVWTSPKSAHGQATVDTAFCRVTGTKAPQDNFEVWLPKPKKWNGKFNGVGNGALGRRHELSGYEGPAG